MSEEEKKIPRYELLPDSEQWFCIIHNRKATNHFYGKGWDSICCDPSLAGITIPCNCVKNIWQIIDERYDTFIRDTKNNINLCTLCPSGFGLNSSSRKVAQKICNFLNLYNIDLKQ